MNRPLRTIALAPFAAFAIALAGCESDIKPVGDALAQDSTLALEVLGARPDSATDLGDTANAELDSPMIASSRPSGEPIMPVAPIEAAPAPVERPASPARSETVNSGPRVASGRVATSTARKTSPRSRATATTRTASSTSGRSPASSIGASTSRVRSTTPMTVQPVIPSRAWLILPAGAVLEFEAGQQICANTSADSFDATLSEDVIRADGIIVPDGAAARGSIIANTAGSDTTPGITIEWLTFNGRMYAVKTRVTETDTKNVRTRTGTRNTTKVAAGAATGAAIGGIVARDAKGALIGAAGGAIAGAIAGSRTPRTYTSCIPDGGRIVAELTEPLRIALSD